MAETRGRKSRCPGLIKRSKFNLSIKNRVQRDFPRICSAPGAPRSEVGTVLERPISQLPVHAREINNAAISRKLAWSTEWLQCQAGVTFSSGPFATLIAVSGSKVGVAR